MSEENKAREFDEILSILGDGAHVLDAGTVYGLSALSRQQLSVLAEHWTGYPTERRLQIIEHLNVVSEANFEMDFKAINHMALNDSDSDVRRHAIEGLWEDESLTLMHRLIDMMQNDPSMAVRAAAASDLGRFILLGEYESLSKADTRLVQNAVFSILKSNEDYELRRKALESISNCNKKGVTEFIREFYEHDELELRMSAIFAMGRTCDTSWAPELIDELNSEYPELQYEAIRAVGHIEMKKAVPHLVTLLEDTDDIEVLDIIIWALGEIGGEIAVETLNNIIVNAELAEEEGLMEAAQEALDAASLPGEFLLFDLDD